MREIKNTRRTLHTDIECVPEGHANGKATNANLDKETIIKNAADAFGKFLDTLGCNWREDPNSMETPMRVAKAYVNDLWKGRFEELPDIPDCVYIAVSRDLTVNVIKNFASIGTGGAVCLASRFSETNSKEGLEKTRQLITNSNGMPFLGPNCYGFINYLDKQKISFEQFQHIPEFFKTNKNQRVLNSDILKEGKMSFLE